MLVFEAYATYPQLIRSEEVTVHVIFIGVCYIPQVRNRLEQRG